MEAAARREAEGDAPAGAHDAGEPAQERRRQAAELRGLLQRVGQLLERHREQADLEAQQRARPGRNGDLQRLCGGVVVAADAPCLKCESHRPLRAYAQKVGAAEARVGGRAGGRAKPYCWVAALGLFTARCVSQQDAAREQLCVLLVPTCQPRQANIS
jgi:hypothetical protein